MPIFNAKKSYGYMKIKKADNEKYMSFYLFQGHMTLRNRYQSIPPLVLSKLYWSISIPQMTYGLEMLPSKENSFKTLEGTHTSIANIIQGLPVNAAPAMALYM